MLELFLTSTYPSVCILNKDVGLLSCICAVFLKLETFSVKVMLKKQFMHLLLQAVLKTP